MEITLSARGYSLRRKALTDSGIKHKNQGRPLVPPGIKHKNQGRPLVPHKAVLYASDPAYLDAVLAEEKGWRELPVPSMSLVVFRREDLAAYSVETFEFVAQEREGAEP